MDIYIPGQDVFFESTPTKNGKKIIIYLSKVGDNLFKHGFLDNACKCFGEYYLEQEFDKDNQIISEVIKKNPHYIEDRSGFYEFDDDEFYE